MAGYTVEIDIGSGRENGHDVKVLDFITGNYITDDCNECDVCEECSRYDDIKFNIGREHGARTDTKYLRTIYRDWDNRHKYLRKKNLIERVWIGLIKFINRHL